MDITKRFISIQGLGVTMICSNYFKGDQRMKKLLSLTFVLLILSCSACSHKEPEGFVFIEAGKFKNTKSNFYQYPQAMEGFYIGKYEVTQKEWTEIMGNNPSHFKGDNLPVEMVSWYDCIEYCNKRSEKEGLEPFYNMNKEKKDSENICQSDEIKWTITINETANGYRLPSESEWEYAASGGQESKNYSYSGSDCADDVGFYWKNAGDKTLSGDWNWPAIEQNNNKTSPVGSKKPNELGLYDMSGNVREWCWDWYVDEENESGIARVWRGGGIIGDVTCCESTYRGKFEPTGTGYDQGFRVCRNK